MLSKTSILSLHTYNSTSLSILLSYITSLLTMQNQSVDDQQCQLEATDAIKQADQARVYYTKEEDIEDDGFQ